MRTVIGLACLATWLAGCQCCRVAERYQDAIDCISDHQGCLDRLYHPELDISRIGRSDWCRWRFNHWWCGKACRCCNPPPQATYLNSYLATCPESQPATEPQQVPEMVPQVPETRPIQPGGESQLTPPSDLMPPPIRPPFEP